METDAVVGIPNVSQSRGKRRSSDSVIEADGPNSAGRDGTRGRGMLLSRSTGRTRRIAGRDAAVRTFKNGFKLRASMPFTAT